MPNVSPLSLDSLIARADGFVEAEVDHEVVALNIEHGTCYCLNRVGSRIWNLISEPTRIGDLCTTLLTEFNVDQNDCHRQVLDLLEELRAEGMIHTPELK